jgi:hypothetical protein
MAAACVHELGGLTPAGAELSAGGQSPSNTGQILVNTGQLGRGVADPQEVELSAGGRGGDGEEGGLETQALRKRLSRGEEPRRDLRPV